jgi:CRP-like cAMP-binding protein
MEKTELIKLFSANAHARRFRTGDCIVQEGAAADDGLCFVLSGSVRIVQHQGERAVPLGRIQTGQFFGETALLLGRTRTASAIADSDDAIIMFLNRERFLAESRSNYHLIHILTGEAVERIQHVIATLVRLQRTIRVQVDPTLLPLMQENRASNLKIPGLLSHTRGIFIGNGQMVFSQGQRNDGQIYLITEGGIGAMRQFDADPVELFRFRPGDFFGYSRMAGAVFREYSAQARDGSAKVISFDEDLLFKLMRLDNELFFMLFRSLLTHLIILDDTLRLNAVSGDRAPGTAATQDTIARALSEGVTE